MSGKISACWKTLILALQILVCSRVTMRSFTKYSIENMQEKKVQEPLSRWHLTPILQLRKFYSSAFSYKTEYLVRPKLLGGGLGVFISPTVVHLSCSLQAPSRRNAEKTALPVAEPGWWTFVWWRPSLTSGKCSSTNLLLLHYTSHSAPPPHSHVARCCPTLSFSNLGQTSVPNLYLLGKEQIPVLAQGAAAKGPKISTTTSELRRQETWETVKCSEPAIQFTGPELQKLDSKMSRCKT